MVNQLPRMVQAEIHQGLVVLLQRDGVCNREMPFQSRIKIERCVSCSRFGERRERALALRRKSGSGRFFRTTRRTRLYLETPGKPSVRALLLNASLATDRKTGTMHESDCGYFVPPAHFPISDSLRGEVCELLFFLLECPRCAVESISQAQPRPPSSCIWRIVLRGEYVAFPALRV